MADLVVTAANVRQGANASFSSGLAGATITAGQAVYLDSTTSTYKLAVANVSAAAATVTGVAINNAASGQPVTVNAEDDDFTPGATLVMGKVYGLSNTAGGLTDVANVAAGWYPTVVLVPKSTTKAILKIVTQTSATV